MNGLLFQQGDVLIERVSGVPKGKKIEPDDRGYVLAEGEVSGHCHKITEVKNITMVKTDDGQIYLTVREAVPLKHEEHHVIIIEPGDYRIGKVREKDHVSKMVREVID